MHDNYARVPSTPYMCSSNLWDNSGQGKQTCAMEGMLPAPKAAALEGSRARQMARTSSQQVPRDGAKTLPGMMGRKGIGGFDEVRVSREGEKAHVVQKREG